MKIYTRTGDDGTTSLVGGKRVSKSCKRLEAYGTVDELSSYLGMVESLFSDMPSAPEKSENIRWIQQKLFCVGGSLATDVTTSEIPAVCMVTAQDIERLESMTDALQQGLPEHHCFILPGGCLAASATHVARTVCRRAERLVVCLQQDSSVPENVAAFLNRLSDYLFVLARKTNQVSHTDEILWK
ncbi:MAG: cob(I)yrinic acid a,c-diamide adenosyltransferase [Bacteroidaceae bacterium]|nr:cob(I)yrinic acid a,c-diamide adenosyltransferase [Bacteroidaceae bacterium]